MAFLEACPGVYPYPPSQGLGRSVKPAALLFELLEDYGNDSYKNLIQGLSVH